MQNYRMDQTSVEVKAENASECMKACEESSVINCVSVSYLPNTKQCFLSLHDRTDRRIVTGDNYEYYERLCEGEHDSLGRNALDDVHGAFTSLDISRDHPDNLKLWFACTVYVHVDFRTG